MCLIGKPPGTHAWMENLLALVLFVVQSVRLWHALTGVSPGETCAPEAAPHSISLWWGTLPYPRTGQSSTSRSGLRALSSAVADTSTTELA